MFAPYLLPDRTEETDEPLSDNRTERVGAHLSGMRVRQL